MRRLTWAASRKSGFPHSGCNMARLKRKIFMATVPKIPLPVHEVENVLAFDQEKIVKSQQTEIFGTVDTSRFDKIRIVAANESTSNVHLWLKIMEPEGGRVEE